MNKYKAYYAVAALFILVFAARSYYQQNGLDAGAFSQRPEDAYETAAKRDILALMMAYPDDVAGVEKSGDRILIVMASGSRFAYDDGRQKSAEQKLADADVQDMMETPYPLQSQETLADSDPGRARCYALLKAVYGGSEGEVEANLTSVDIGCGSCPFNVKNGAAKALGAAFRDISELLKTDPSVYGFVYPLSGTFNYRVIAGTGHLSPHAFGIAIDLCRDSRDYWQWADRQQGQKRLDEYPAALVSVLESHGFIWGGKWAHFDFLHFEYRPELIIKAQCAKSGALRTWYDGFPDTDTVKGYIRIIEQAWK